MAKKLQIPLNGSNIVSKNRHQAFNKALEDNHQVRGGSNRGIKVSPADPSQEKSLPDLKPRLSGHPEKGPSREVREAGQALSHLSLALEHTYRHQTRTMEIHQQYLTQGADYLKLITAVLDQQGRVLDQSQGQSAAEMLQTFQRTLDNFHALREQGIKVHQEFLQQQAAFSERYLQALEGTQAGSPGVDKLSPAPRHKAQVTEWVVQQPPIVVDEHSAPPPASVQEDQPAEASQPEPEVSQPLSGGVSSAELADALLEIVADKTGYPADMLELDMDLEADLGIDSIKRVEILSSLEESYPSLPPVNTELLAQTRTLQEILAYLEEETDSSSQPIPTVQEAAKPEPSTGAAPNPAAAAGSEVFSLASLTETLMEIVAEKTGYPADMLEADMDLEADLGIDSIKRVEILGTMEERLPGLPSVDAESLAELRTLGQIVEMMGNNAGSQPAEVSGGEENKKKAQPIIPETTPVGLQTLPEPDQLELLPDAQRPLILSDDGTDFSLKTAALLKDRGWNVLVWTFPDEYYSGKKDGGPADIPVIHQETSGREGIDKALAKIRAEHGSPSCFIHIHPVFSSEGLFSDAEENLIKQVFLLAGALKDDLSQVSGADRNLFLAVTRTDGALGHQGSESFQEGSGLSGLIKTLRWEWPDVFCRFVDISPDMGTKEASQSLLREIHDPDRGQVEVGVSPTARVTINREY